MKHCKDCEPAQQIHWAAYLSVVLGVIDEPFFDFMEKIFGKTVESVSKKFSIPFYKILTFLRLGHFTDKYDEKDTWRTRCFWDEATRRGIKMQEFYLGPVGDSFIAEYNNKKMLFEGLPRQNTMDSPALRWMDNKGVMKKRFLEEGLPVAKGGVAFRKSTALKIFESLEKPVITKPNLGSRSRHTLIHINTTEELLFGFKKAKKLSPFIIVEEELRGSLFRGTLVGEKLVAVIRRDPPQVIGDGINTLEYLWKKENERTERKGPVFHEINIDKESEKELARQNIKMSDIPAKDIVITFSQKTSRGVGGTTTEVSDIVHPDNKEMLEHVGRYLNDTLIGVDFIMEDITKSWHEQPRCGIIECNSLPFIDLHHYPLFGAPVNVAGKLWDMVLPESNPALTR